MLPIYRRFFKNHIYRVVSFLFTIGYLFFYVFTFYVVSKIAPPTVRYGAIIVLSLLFLLIFIVFPVLISRSTKVSYPSYIASWAIVKLCLRSSFFISPPRSQHSRWLHWLVGDNFPSVIGLLAVLWVLFFSVQDVIHADYPHAIFEATFAGMLLFTDWLGNFQNDDDHDDHDERDDDGPRFPGGMQRELQHNTGRSV